MVQWETLYPDAESLYTTLLKCRTAGRNRSIQLKPLLDAIVDTECDWTDLQCANCFRNLLEKYIDPNMLDLLLSAAGLEEDYANIKTASKRREVYSKKHLENTYEVDLKTLEKRENTELSNMAKFMWRDYTTDPAILIRAITDSLTEKEIRSLAFDTKGVDQEENFYPESESSQRFTRDYCVYNIAVSREFFVGRKVPLQVIEKRFKDGKHIQIIGGANGIGKTRLALEYAKSHVDEYRIICWINGYSKAHIIDSTLNFLKLVDVEVTDRLINSIPQIFCAFFEQNTDWLIIIDNADLVHSAQYKILKEYIPNGSGDILITSNTNMQVDGAESYLLDSLINSDGDWESFVKRRLGLEALNTNDLELAARCNGNPVTLTLVTSYITDLAWVDSRIYLHMLNDRGVNAGPQSHHTVESIAFDLLIEDIDTKRKYHNNSLCLAVRQILLICAKLNYNYLDFNLLAGVFSVLPEDIIKVYENMDTRKQFTDMLKLFGIYEVNDGQMIINEGVRSLATDFFKAQDGWDTLEELYYNTEKTILSIINNQFVGNKETVLARLKPYTDNMYAYLAVAHDEVKLEYPYLTALVLDQ